MRLVTTEEMRRLERRAFEAGTTEAALMETAGTAVGRATAEWLANPAGRRLLVLAGRGNNGGDALIAARVLAQDYGAHPSIYLLADRRDDPLLAWAAAGAPVTPVVVHGARTLRTLRDWLAAAEVVLDGVLGIGSRLPLEGAVAEVLRACREVRPRGQRRIAVDVPTGVHADTGQADASAFGADLTLSTGPAKPGLFIHPGAACAGRVRALDIGIGGFEGHTGAGGKPAIHRADAAEVAALLPDRPDDSHKGTYGKVLVIAGSGHYVGAAYLAGAAAVRAGAGLVTLAIPAAAQQAIAGRSVETTFLPLPDDPAAPGSLTPGHLGALLSAADTYDAVALGPGLGSDPATRKLVLLLLERWAGSSKAPPVLLDADALNALAAAPAWPHPARPSWILTPHPGEMGRLAGLPVADVQSGRLGLACDKAREWGVVVVLKGAPSIIATPDGDVTLNAFANAALATAGSGDVLTGATAALLAQGCSPAAAAVAGSYVHGLAAELWRAEHGAAGLPAGDLVDRLPAALEHLRRLRR